MKQFLCLAAVLALASADYPGNVHPTECGPLQKLKFKTQWHEAYSQAEDREHLDEDVFRELFRLHPEWRMEYFSRVRAQDIHSPEFRAHMARLMDAFDMAVALLTEPEVFAEEMKHLGHKHHELGIPEDHFDVFRGAIIHAAEMRIGHCFNWDAWDLCTKVITHGIQDIVHADAEEAAAAEAAAAA